MWNRDPDYAGLVKLLPVLRNLVDACGEVTLTPEEAARIRSLGFAAQEGRWKVPPVPPEFVRDNPLLEHLAIGYGSRLLDVPGALPTGNERGRVTGTREHPGTVPQTKAASSEAMRAESELADVGQKIIQVLENAGGKIVKRRLQQKLWRYSATTFNKALQDLVGCGLATLQGQWVAFQGAVTQTHADAAAGGLSNKRDGN